LEKHKIKPDPEQKKTREKGRVEFSQTATSARGPGRKNK